jgi:flagellar biosynthesis component FlhA
MAFKDFKRKMSDKASTYQRRASTTPTPQWMQGRYGSDQLGKLLLVLSLACIVLSLIPNLSLLALVGLAILVICYWRLFSKRVDKRYQENLHYLRATAGIRRRARKVRKRYANRKVYAYMKCPQCHQKMRVPKGKGTVRIVCPSCKKEFQAKS